MPKIKICTVCGSEFVSHNGTEVCSESCRLERKREQDRKGNKRRYAKESNTPFNRVCPICGREFESLKNFYCSAECTGKARKQNIKENNMAYYRENRERILANAKNKNERKKEGKRNGNIVHWEEICGQG